MTIPAFLLSGLAAFAVGASLTACGGGGGATAATNGSGAGPAPGTAAATAGVWTGTIASSATGQSSPVVALTGPDGHSLWMAADGRTWSGQLPVHGERFSASFAGHMHEGAQFPDGTNHGAAEMRFEHHAATTTRGSHAGCGDAGTFEMSASPMWARDASLGALAGVYSRSTSSGYTMTITIHADGQLSGGDSRGCVVSGTVDVPDAHHNRYGIHATVTSCGTLDGRYEGGGTLLDADAMRGWMTAMHPLEHGGHSHGGHGGMGHNVVPSGHHNLFVFSMFNDRGAMMDALAR